jgi:hypothetical protein
LIAQAAMPASNTETEERSGTARMGHLLEKSAGFVWRPWNRL